MHVYQINNLTFQNKKIIKSCPVDCVNVNPYSTFHQYVAQGIYLPCGVVIEIFRLAATNNMRPITLC